MIEVVLYILVGLAFTSAITMHLRAEMAELRRRDDARRRLLEFE